MLGILLNFIALLIFGFIMQVQSTGVMIFLAVVIFLLISFGFSISQARRSESDSCLYCLLMLANMIFSGLLLLALIGAFCMHCGCV